MLLTLLARERLLVTHQNEPCAIKASKASTLFHANRVNLKASEVSRLLLKVLKSFKGCWDFREISPSSSTTLSLMESEAVALPSFNGKGPGAVINN